MYSLRTTVLTFQTSGHCDPGAVWTCLKPCWQVLPKVTTFLLLNKDYTVGSVAAPVSRHPLPRPQDPHPGTETCFPGEGLQECCSGSIRGGADHRLWELLQQVRCGQRRRV